MAIENGDPTTLYYGYENRTDVESLQNSGIKHCSEMKAENLFKNKLN